MRVTAAMLVVSMQSIGSDRQTLPLSCACLEPRLLRIEDKTDPKRQVKRASKISLYFCARIVEDSNETKTLIRSLFVMRASSWGERGRNVP